MFLKVIGASLGRSTVTIRSLETIYYKALHARESREIHRRKSNLQEHFHKRKKNTPLTRGVPLEARRYRASCGAGSRSATSACRHTYRDSIRRRAHSPSVRPECSRGREALAGSFHKNPVPASCGATPVKGTAFCTASCLSRLYCTRRASVVKRHIHKEKGRPEGHP